MKFDNIYISSSYFNVTAFGFYPGGNDTRTIYITGAETSFFAQFSLLIYLCVIIGIGLCCAIVFRQTILSQSYSKGIFADAQPGDLDSSQALINPEEGNSNDLRNEDEKRIDNNPGVELEQIKE